MLAPRAQKQWLAVRVCGSFHLFQSSSFLADAFVASTYCDGLAGQQQEHVPEGKKHEHVPKTLRKKDVWMAADHAHHDSG